MTGLDPTLTAFDEMVTTTQLAHLTKSRAKGPPGRGRPQEQGKPQKKKTQEISPAVQPAETILPSVAVRKKRPTVERLAPRDPDGKTGGSVTTEKMADHGSIEVVEGKAPAQVVEQKLNDCVPEEGGGVSKTVEVKEAWQKHTPNSKSGEKLADTATAVSDELQVISKRLKSEDNQLKPVESKLQPVSTVQSVSSDVPSPNKLSIARSEVGVAPAEKSHLQHILDKIMRNLQDKRRKINRPESLAEMTWAEVKDEKRHVQMAIIQFERQYGRPQSKPGKDTVKPLYTRYKEIKKIVSDGQAAHEAGLKRTTPPDHGLDCTLPNITLSQSLPQMMSKDALVEPMSESLSLLSQTTPTGWEQDTSALHFDDLVKEQEELLKEKKSLRKTLLEFEHSFQKQNGRPLEKADRQGMSSEYSRYKHIKSCLRTLSDRISATQRSV